MILRKGAISARERERVIIPMNMRDGSLICIGKGNPDWTTPLLTVPAGSCPAPTPSIRSRWKTSRRIWKA